jgi:hypothetical protein
MLRRDRELCELGALGEDDREAGDLFGVPRGDAQAAVPAPRDRLDGVLRSGERVVTPKAAEGARARP